MKRIAVWLAAIGLLAAGNAAAQAAPPAPAAAGTRWVIEPTQSRAHLVNQLNGVSCTSASACTAVGGPPLGLGGREITISERWDGRRWTIQPTPNPRGAVGAALWGVSCSSLRACMAVGTEQVGKDFRTLAERWNGSRWSIQPTPTPASAIAAGLVGVSCPAANECLAVGDYNGASGPVFGLIERWNGSRWAIAAVISPADASQTLLRGVSCSSVSRCTAVGSFELTSSPIGPYPLAELWTGSRWRPQVTPGKGQLTAVSCPAFFHCTAVGEYNPNGNGGPPAMLAMRWSGRGWKRQRAPEPRGANQGHLFSVSCPTVTSCTAVGWSAVNQGFDYVTVVERWNRLSWKIQVTPNPAAQAYLNGVWCVSPFTCRAVGTYYARSGQNNLAEGD